MHPALSRDQSSMRSSDLYGQKTLFWTCRDALQLVQPLVQQSLRDWAETRGIDLQQRTADWRPVGTQILGFNVWAVWNPSEVQAVLVAIQEQRTIHPAAVQLAVVAQSCTEHYSRLVQTGVQIVVHPLSSLPTTLRTIADKMPCCLSNNNPLTQGLLEFPELRWPRESSVTGDSAI